MHIFGRTFTLEFLLVTKLYIMKSVLCEILKIRAGVKFYYIVTNQYIT
jgi:hypothetical protein